MTDFGGEAVGGQSPVPQGGAIDVSALKKAEEELRLLNRTLEERVRERCAGELERAREEWNELGRVMAHDLREPLRSMYSFTKKLAAQAEGQLNEQARGCLERVVQSADRIKEKIDRLLDYAIVRTEERSFAWVECSEAFAAACANLHAAIEASGARVTAGTLPRVWGRRMQLEMLFLNLIDNALKFRAAGRAPVVRVEAREQGEDWLVTVTDNGIGIEAKYLQRIFVLGMGARLNSVRDYPGHGIGLATCARIVERHGGRIWAESPGPDQGATLAFILPSRPPAG